MNNNEYMNYKLDEKAMKRQQQEKYRRFLEEQIKEKNSQKDKEKYYNRPQSHKPILYSNNNKVNITAPSIPNNITQSYNNQNNYNNDNVNSYNQYNQMNPNPYFQFNSNQYSNYSANNRTEHIDQNNNFDYNNSTSNDVISNDLTSKYNHDYNLNKIGNNENLSFISPLNPLNTNYMNNNLGNNNPYRSIPNNLDYLNYKEIINSQTNNGISKNTHKLDPYQAKEMNDANSNNVIIEKNDKSKPYFLNDEKENEIQIKKDKQLRYKEELQRQIELNKNKKEEEKRKLREEDLKLYEKLKEEEFSKVRIKSGKMRVNNTKPTESSPIRNNVFDSNLENKDSGLGLFNKRSNEQNKNALPNILNNNTMQNSYSSNSYKNNINLSNINSNPSYNNYNNNEMNKVNNNEQEMLQNSNISNKLRPHSNYMNLRRSREQQNYSDLNNHVIMEEKDEISKYNNIIPNTNYNTGLNTYTNEFYNNNILNNTVNPNINYNNNIKSNALNDQHLLNILLEEEKRIQLMKYQLMNTNIANTTNNVNNISGINDMINVNNLSSLRNPQQIINPDYSYFNNIVQNNNEILPSSIRRPNNHSIPYKNISQINNLTSSTICALQFKSKYEQLDLSTNRESRDQIKMNNIIQNKNKLPSLTHSQQMYNNLITNTHNVEDEKTVSNKKVIINNTENNDIRTKSNFQKPINKHLTINDLNEDNTYDQSLSSFYNNPKELDCESKLVTIIDKGDKTLLKSYRKDIVNKNDFREMKKSINKRISIDASHEGKKNPTEVHIENDNFITIKETIYQESITDSKDSNNNNFYNDKSKASLIKTENSPFKNDFINTNSKKSVHTYNKSDQYNHFSNLTKSFNINSNTSVDLEKNEDINIITTKDTTTTALKTKFPAFKMSENQPSLNISSKKFSLINSNKKNTLERAKTMFMRKNSEMRYEELSDIYTTQLQKSTNNKSIRNTESNNEEQIEKQYKQYPPLIRDITEEENNNYKGDNIPEVYENYTHSNTNNTNNTNLTNNYYKNEETKNEEVNEDDNELNDSLANFNHFEYVQDYESDNKEDDSFKIETNIEENTKNNKNENSNIKDSRSLSGSMKFKSNIYEQTANFKNNMRSSYKTDEIANNNGEEKYSTKNLHDSITNNSKDKERNNSDQEDYEKTYTFDHNKDIDDEDNEIEENNNEFNKILEKEKLQSKANFFEDNSDSEIRGNYEKQIHVIQSNFERENKTFNRGFTVDNNRINDYYNKFRHLNLLEEALDNEIDLINLTKRKNTEIKSLNLDSKNNVINEISNSITDRDANNVDDKINYYAESLNSRANDKAIIENTCFPEDRINNDYEENDENVNMSYLNRNYKEMFGINKTSKDFYKNDETNNFDDLNNNNYDTSFHEDDLLNELANFRKIALNNNKFN